MHSELTTTLALAVAVGVGMQWTALKTRVPALLLLMLSGAVLGNSAFHIIDPSDLGRGLAPLVTLSVALILFEGALNLRIADLSRAPGAVLRLLTIGAGITVVLTTIISYYVLGLDIGLSLLLGTILMVTGPTVVQPILRRIHVSHTLRSVLTWEGILIDPIGAVAALVVFEIVTHSYGSATASSPFVILGSYPARMAVGTLIGGIGGLLLSKLLANPKLAPTKEDDMNNMLALGVMLGLFTAADALVSESGIVAATVAGVMVANSKTQGLEDLKLFKGQLATILIGTLFVLLAAPIDLNKLIYENASVHIFVALMVFVVRPVSVAIGTYRTNLTWREKVYCAFFAPRGIIAVAIASLFGTELVRNGVPEAQLIVDATYETILVTVALTAIIASPLANILKVTAPKRNGLLIVGGTPFGRAIGHAIKDEIPLLIVDSNQRNCLSAQVQDLPSVCGSATDEQVLDGLGFEEMGSVLAITPNEEVNTLVCEWAKDEVGPKNSFQARLEKTTQLSAAQKVGLGGLSAFARVLPLEAISRSIEEGKAKVRVVDKYKSDGVINNEGLGEMLSGQYVLGWLGKKAFTLYTEEMKTTQTSRALVLEVYDQAIK